MDRKAKEDGSLWRITRINAKREAAKHIVAAEEVIRALHATGPES